MSLPISLVIDWIDGKKKTKNNNKKKVKNTSKSTLEGNLLS